MIRTACVLFAACHATAGPGKGKGPPPPPPHPDQSTTPLEAYAAALTEVDFKAVKEDLLDLFTDSKDHWPADYGNYAPFFVRLAWHCSGSYRTSDGRGGCEGGRQRFEPERSWDDNTNLDKARGLLWPVKQKYGLGLSWGDLFILAGTTAVESMGGPVLGFCGGRVDAADGAWSQELGPTAAQEEVAPCPVNGDCDEPLGSTTVGLIYLNPEGPMGQPIPDQSALQVRDAFGRMNMNDTETVALIGGGHSFGKAHGACPDGAGPSPAEEPLNPWPGKCAAGSFTSGFEGAWTVNPLQWDNGYFQVLQDNEWEAQVGPGGHYQWHVANGTNPVAPDASGDGTQPTMMLTSDVSLTKDDKYAAIVAQFADDLGAFDAAFAHAWYKLVTRDMGPVERCVGDLVPPAQPFQYPLPASPAKEDLPEFSAVREELVNVLTTSNSNLQPDTTASGTSYGSVFIHLAYQCASTFRTTDHLGGCNGARIRFAPQSEWKANTAMDEALQVLAPIKDKFGDGLSWSDLIVLAGQVAVEEAGGLQMPFCPGRTDAADGAGSEYLKENLWTSYSGPDADAKELLETTKMMGLTVREMTALMGRPRSWEQEQRMGFNGSWTRDAGAFDNSYFTTLLAETWQEMDGGEYKAVGKELYIHARDLALRAEPVFLTHVHDFAADADVFKAEFAQAWTKLVTQDRFDGPLSSCKHPVGPSPPKVSAPLLWGIVAGSVGGTLFLGVICMGLWRCWNARKRSDGTYYHGAGDRSPHISGLSTNRLLDNHN